MEKMCFNGRAAAGGRLWGRRVRLAMLGKIEHDGCLNPVPGSEVDFRHKL